jgi:carbamoyl-phosphate synthase/aspartate carbamoyltransferase/dihydroorotase
LGTPEDVAALWAHINTTIDCIATDHAPHTLAEKASATPPPGIVGLETSLPLMITAVENGRLSLDRLIQLMHTNPRRIFNLPAQPDTHVEVEMTPSTIQNDKLFTKVGWTPFAGTPVAGQVKRVILRGQTVFEDGQLLAQPGSGKVLTKSLIKNR